MKGIISGIKRLAVHDGDGLRTTVFFKGCPLRCIWCHNPETFSFKKEIAFYEHKCIGCSSCIEECKQGALSVDGLDKSRCIGCGKCSEVCPTDARTLYGIEYEASELVKKLLEDRDFFENGHGGITLSGGECLMQIDFAAEVARLLAEEGINVNIDTCGYVTRKSLERIIPYTDVFLYDIKAIDRDVHIKCTGKDNELILSNLKFLSEKGCKIEIRYPLVKGYNDGECEKIGRFLQGIKGISKIKVLKYHALAKSKYEALGFENTLPDTVTTDEDIEKAVQILSSFGLNALNGAKDD